MATVPRGTFKGKEKVEKRDVGRLNQLPPIAIGTPITY